MKKSIKSAFSLMEMMVVLLIVAIIAAASAPMVSKKLARDSEATGSSPWIYTGTGLNIAYNMSASSSGSAVIGATDLPAETGSNRIFKGAGLFIQAAKRTGNERTPHIRFFRTEGGSIVNMYADSNDKAVMITDTHGTGSKALNDVVAIGTNQAIDRKVDNQKIIAIGNDVSATTNSIVIGNAFSNSKKTSVTGSGIAIGNGASAVNGVAIGTGSEADKLTESTGTGVAIGSGAQAKADGSIAIGAGAVATTNSGDINIGNTFKKNNTTITIGTGNETIVLNGSEIKLGSFVIQKGSQYNEYGSGYTYYLGTGNDQIYIPGDFQAAQNVRLAYGNQTSKIYVNVPETNNQTSRFVGQVHVSHNDEHNQFLWIADDGSTSDRRLKNVGDKFKGGLEELKKLDLYHYTFKKDESKTPHVGVMAQDLQKVFPNAVTKGGDGYLRIRWDEMFFALINAVKELDNKILELASRVQKNADAVIEMKKTITEQQATIDELKAQNAEFEKRLAKIEKAMKK